MTAHPSDAELYFERLLAVVADPDAGLTGLYPYSLHLVILTRLEYAHLMLALAVRLEGGK